GGQRRYGRDVIGQVQLLQVARDAGFTIAETQALVSGFAATTTASLRWRTLAQRKLVEIDGRMRQLRRMRTLLVASAECRCVSLEDCARIIGAGRAGVVLPSTRRSS
ncbi:MAG: MerR family DNA-binding protein, partial [Gemmatimonadales bacterium]